MIFAGLIFTTQNKIILRLFIYFFVMHLTTTKLPQSRLLFDGFRKGNLIFLNVAQ